MRHGSLGIFGRVFLYTMLILAIVIGVTVLFFTRQISDVLSVSQRQHFSELFGPLQRQLEGRAEGEAAALAAAFGQRNPSFVFCIRTWQGVTLYASPDFPDEGTGISVLFPDGAEGFLDRTRPFSEDRPLTPGADFPGSPNLLFESDARLNAELRMFVMMGGGYRIFVSTPHFGAGLYGEALQRTAVAVLLMLAAGGLCAFLFARGIARPVRALARDTARMSRLGPVSPPTTHSDEIGRMADDVYRMYEQLKETIRKLELEICRERQMEENQRYFFLAASHELKTPVAAASALLEGLLEEVIPPAETAETLRDCRAMMTEQGKLISEILELVRLENRHDHPKRDRVCLREAVSATLPACVTLAEARGQTIEVCLPDEIHCAVDEALFSRVLSNILSNAIQNTPQGGTIRVSCASRGPKTTRLSVENEGARIPDEIWPNLFEPFYRADKARSRRQGHSGLGLTLVQKALKRMDIPFALENTEKGVVFWMELRFC